MTSVIKSGVPIPGPGQTRLCRDPWIYPAILADGEIVRCCFGGASFGTWTVGASLIELMNSPGARAARQTLLDGTLDGVCRNCPRFPIVSVEDYRPHIEWLQSTMQHTASKAHTTDLTSCATVDNIWLELTSRCNLRCVYCHQSSQDFHGQDMPVHVIDELIDQLITLGIKGVSLTGRGENTFLPGWERYAERFLDHGIKVSIITNLARPISDRESRLFARMAEVCVSIDSLDRDVFKRLRTGDVRIVLHNVARILGAAVRIANPGFEMRWAAVISAPMAPGLVDLVATGIAMGVKRFSFLNLLGVNGVGGPNHPGTFADLDQTSLLSIRRAVEAATALIRERCGDGALDLQPDLLAAIDQALRRTESKGV